MKMEDMGQEPRNAGVIVRGNRRSESFAVMRGVTAEREVAVIPGRGHELSNRVKAGSSKGKRNDSPLVGRRSHTLTLVQ